MTFSPLRPASRARARTVAWERLENRDFWWDRHERNSVRNRLTTSSRSRLGAGVLLTPDKFERDHGFTTTDLGTSCIRGVLVVDPVPSGRPKRRPTTSLGAMLRQYLLASIQRVRPLDETSPERYVRTSTGRRRADRVVWTRLGRRPDPAADIPSIVVEFVFISANTDAAITRKTPRVSTGGSRRVLDRRSSRSANDGLSPYA